jgi:hypothetical protein
MNNKGSIDACVFYIPSVPLTENNVVSTPRLSPSLYESSLNCRTLYNQQYISQQRDALLKGIPPPDFPGGLGESTFADRATPSDIQSEAGKRAMGLRKFPVKDTDTVQGALAKRANEILGYP